MERLAILKISVFVAASYIIAFVLDFTAASFKLFTYPWGPSVWGFMRMWSVAGSAVLCSTIFREGVSTLFKQYIKVSKRAILYYFASPLIVYGALALYILVALPLNLFNFSVYVEVIADVLRSTLTSLSEEQILSLATISAYSQILAAYLSAVTINAFFALGEEIGWRGYIYRVLGSKPNLYSTVAVGILWGLWHSPAILLLGYNYSINRVLGVALFTLCTIALSYPHLIVTTVTGSVLPASSLHGAVNALWGLTIIASDLPMELKEVWLGLGLLGIAAWTTTSVILYALSRWRCFQGSGATLYMLF
ncbi:MAG: CPBP family intramembrane glutamic endopeptidase [Ignisphaera sp.]|nr:CPBP family intramembrane metalloprotease [Ignisphaera sp.]MDW8084849.1 CPBP family intramembrane glutamic endopeptidase [Ignisphaera sp.]